MERKAGASGPEEKFGLISGRIIPDLGSISTKPAEMEMSPSSTTLVNLALKEYFTTPESEVDPKV